MMNSASDSRKTFPVLLTAYRTVLVSAENKEEAAKLASENVHDFDWEIEDYNVGEELTTEEQIDSAKRHGATVLFED